MKLACVLLALCCVVGCQPAGPPALATSVPSAPPQQTIASDIRGDWQLKRLDDRASDEQPLQGDIPATIRLVVGDVTMRATSQCVGFAWRYEKSGDVITLTPDNPGPMCARGLTTWETDFDRRLGAATEAKVIDGILRVTGPAGALEFGPTPPQAIVDVAGAWRLVRLDGRQAQVGRDPPDDVRVVITGDTLRAQSQCVSMWWTYRQSGGQVETKPDNPGPVCERMHTEWEQTFARVIDGANIVHRLSGGTMVIAGAGGQAEFTREN